MGIKEMFSLEGKVAIVTGGAGHIGSAISEILATAGAKVVIAGLDSEKSKKKAGEIIKECGEGCSGITMDIASPQKVRKAMRTIAEDFGGIDILVNNAYFGGRGSIEDISDKNWEKGIDGTINSVFRCSQSVIQHMEKRKGGSIINISSIYGMVSPDPSIYGGTDYHNPPNYGAGKAAIIQFTRFGACHLAGKNIRMNCVTPGAFPNKEVQKDVKFISKLEKKIPAGRIGLPRDIKGAVLFLASEASSYVTGVNLVVDGGWTAW
ncbi:MAG: SDR family oxidoreductase [Candidatus Omnitrophota bacterium]